MRGFRYHVVQSERVTGQEPEWDVLDRTRTHENCPGCPGTVVHTATSRKAAREEAAKLNAACAATPAVAPSEQP